MYERALEVLGDLERIGGAIFDDLERRDEAMRDAANEWWYSLTDEERAEREREDEALYEAYLNGHL